MLKEVKYIEIGKGYKAVPIYSNDWTLLDILFSVVITVLVFIACYFVLLHLTTAAMKLFLFALYGLG